MTDLKAAVFTVLEGWALPLDARKILETAYYAQPEQLHPDHYVEVYIRVGDLHVKKVLTQNELSHAYDPIKLLSLVADDCVQKIKELS